MALISVISLAATLLAPLLEQQTPDVRVSFQYFQDGAAHFVASNGGSRPGTIGEAWLDYVGHTKPERHYLLEKTENRFISPASSHQLSFAIPCEDNFSGVQYQKLERFGAHPISATELVVSIVQFDGAHELRRFPIDELPGIMAITDAHHDCVQAQLLGAATATPHRKGTAAK